MVAAVLMMTGCNGQQSGVADGGGKDPKQAVCRDSNTLSTKRISKHIRNVSGEYKLTIDFPESNNALLDHAIREYISESLGATYGGGEEDSKQGSYNGDLADGEKMAAYYLDIKVKEFSALYNDMKRDGMPNVPQLSSEIEITRGYENPKVVTYNFSRYEYAGGAHGGAVGSGMTFRKSDGRRIGWEIFHTAKMQRILRNGLKTYFEVGSDDALTDCLNTESLNDIPMPVTPPLFTEEGITVIYQQYEIAAYAAGMPSFTIPYGEARELLNATGKKLLP